MNASSPTLSFNAGRRSIPASVMKLVTTFAALGASGPSYT